MKILCSTIVCLLSSYLLVSQTTDIHKNLPRLDSLVEASMKKRKIIGASYAIVKGDSVYAIKSFGYANAEKKIPLTNEHQHMFGSISKTITATLILQLVNEGSLDLKKDIREYVPYIKLKYPTTLHHLLTHTGGFEEKLLRRMRLQGMKFETLKKFLSTEMPHQVSRPGEVATYSNYGIALAGLIAEEVTGVPFEELIEKKVLTPLKMKTASFSFPESFVKNSATPYTNGKPASLEYVQTIPASMLTGSIKDLANFTLFQLNPEKYEGAIHKRVIDQMQSTQFVPNKNLYGRGYGFFERVFRNKKGFLHGNTRNGFFSLLYIIPEDDFGIIVTATGNNNRFRSDVVYGFLRMMYDLKASNYKVKTPSSDLLKEISGSFFSTRTNKTQMERILYILNPQRLNTRVKNKKLIVSGSTYEYIGDNTFQLEGGQHKIAFKKTKSGFYLMMPGRSDFYKKVSFFNLPWPHTYLIIFLGLVFIILMIRSLITFKKSKQTQKKTLMLLINSSGGIFMLIFSISVALIGTDLQYDVPSYFYLLFALPIVYCISYILFFIKVIKSKLNVSSLLYLLTGALFCFELYYWNFIGWKF